MVSRIQIQPMLRLNIHFFSILPQTPILIQIQPMLRLNNIKLALKVRINIIQIQPMLRLNVIYGLEMRCKFPIQIQPMLRLNSRQRPY